MILTSSIGEPAVRKYQSQSKVLYQGFLQPFLIRVEEEPHHENGFVYFPNPVVDFLNIYADSSEINYLIFNVIGQKIKEGKIENNRISFQNFSQGMYLLQLLDNSYSLIQTLKIIKQ